MRKIKVLLGSRPEPIGVLSYDATPGKRLSAFEYSDDWLNDPRRFEIDPKLPLVTGEHYRVSTRGGNPLFGAFADAGPDRWGLLLIARKLRNQLNPKSPRSFTPLDYLLEVSDEYRCGALRFKDEAGQMVGLGSDVAIPTSVPVTDLITAAEAVEREIETAEQLNMLLCDGAAVGGHRPKASITNENGALAIAKFPSIQDVRSVAKGEVLALRLSALAGIRTTDFALMNVGAKPVVLVKRFDRTADGKRLHYLSGKSMIEDAGPTEANYVALAEVLRIRGKDPQRDLPELFKRLIFNVLASNFDDHLGNFGFLHIERGMYRLSPSFDINPFPDSPRELSTWISGDIGPAATIDGCLAAARSFGLSSAAARTIIADIGQVVAGWRHVASAPDIGMTNREVDMFANAFEHPELAAALRLDPAPAPARPGLTPPSTPSTTFGPFG